MFTLWIYEAGRAQLVTSARHQHTLRLMWRPHRDAVIADGSGAIVDQKATIEAVALRAITRALATAPVVTAATLEHEEADAPTVEASAPVPGEEPPAAAAELPAPPPPAECSHTPPPPAPAAPATPSTPAPCTARGCTGTVPPGPARPGLEDLCAGHRLQARRAAARLGVDELDAARAIRTHGAATRGTVTLSRAA